MAAESPATDAIAVARRRGAQTGREFSPPPGGCQRSAPRPPARAIAIALLGLALPGWSVGGSPASASAAPPRAAAAPPGDAAAAARALGDRLAAVRGVTARFTQTLDSASLPAPQVEEGIVYLMRPGRMRWEYTRPAGKLAVTDGSRSWLYLPDEREVLTAPLDGTGAAQGATLLVRDRPDVLHDFQAAWGPSSGGRPVLALTPRVPGASYDQILVETDAGGFPSCLTVVDPLGGRVAYRFTAVRFSDSLDPSLFRFTPPPGVPIQGQDR